MKYKSNVAKGLGGGFQGYNDKYIELDVEYAIWNNSDGRIAVYGSGSAGAKSAMVFQEVYLARATKEMARSMVAKTPFDSANSSE